MRPGRVFVVYRSAALSLANSNMRRRQAKDAATGADQRCCTKENCLTCCKKFTAFMFSRVGLFIVMIGYVAFGGWLFQTLEAGNEQNMRRAMGLELNSTLDKLWIEILRVNAYPYMDKKGNFSLYAIHELERFETTIIRQVQQGFDGRTRTDADHDWNYFGAILYAVTLISTIGYGHITTKTTQGKIATILYSAFGVPLMMLFVANIGSTMAKMFAFVFSRITMVFCCRMSNKKKRAAAAVAMKNARKTAANQSQQTTVLDGKPPGSIMRTVPMLSSSKEAPLTTKSSLKRSKDEKESTEKMPLSSDRSPKLRFQTLPNSSTSVSHVSLVSAATDVVDGPSTTTASDLRQLPADVRLNMLTGAPNKRLTSTSTTRSTTSSTGERSKDAIFRINELIRQNSVQDVEGKEDDDDDVLLPSSMSAYASIDNKKRRRSAELNPIEFYINETNKLTNNLDSQSQDETVEESAITDKPPPPQQQQLSEQSKATVNTNDDEANMQQIASSDVATSPVNTDGNNLTIVDESKKLSKKQLKRSKSESTHNRQSRTKIEAPLAAAESTPPNETESSTTTTAAATKPSRRRFFLRKNGKLKKQAVVEEKEEKESTSPLHRQLSADDAICQVNETKTSGLMRKSLSFNESSRPLPPPPNYEESTTKEIVPLPTATVTWKPQDQLHSTTKTTFDLTSIDEEDDEDFYDDDEQMSVPLLVTVFVIPLYLTLGAILFNIWEKWGFLNSFYFCFITLTTIGFGDFVPGSSLTVSAAKEKLISAALYILLGLVLIAMCFNLMKEQLSQKVKRVAGKWGIHEF